METEKRVELRIESTNSGHIIIDVRDQSRYFASTIEDVIWHVRRLMTGAKS